MVAVEFWFRRFSSKISANQDHLKLRRNVADLANMRGVEPWFEPRAGAAQGPPPPNPWTASLQHWTPESLVGF